MLISFSVENWKSFRDKTEFSMVASDEKQHEERVPEVPQYPLHILPIAAIYGGNASGKTNFFDALRFVQNMVIKPPVPHKSIPVKPFLLDKGMATKPASFLLEILIDDVIYKFSFSVNKDVILEEKLIEMTHASKQENILYHRQRQTMTSSDSVSDENVLQYMYKTTRPNQLILANSVEQNLSNFEKVFSWFKHGLALITPNARIQSSRPFVGGATAFQDFMSERLDELDTGIHRLGGQPFLFDDDPYWAEMIERCGKSLDEGWSRKLALPSPDGHRIQLVITRQDGQLTAIKLIPYRMRRADDQEALFDFSQEFAGVQRLMDLLPALHDLENADAFGSNRFDGVYIIDEFDRSLHTLLTRELLDSYLATCSPKSRAQLIFITHDPLLINQRLLRRDEIWVAERNSQGASDLDSFSSFDGLDEKTDIRGYYLQGRLGGVPRFFL